MDQPGSSQQPHSSWTENPVAAVGRKVKSVLSTNDHRPSVRILRHSVVTPEHRRAPLPAESAPSQSASPPNGGASSGRGIQGVFNSLFGHEGQHAEKEAVHNENENEYDSETVNLLDVMDPEVATLSTLTNVQNSLFVPSLGRILDRRPKYTLSTRYGEAGILDKVRASLKRISSPEEETEKVVETVPRPQRPHEPPPRLPPRAGAVSHLSKAQYAILPDGEILLDWTDAEKAELDDLVRHQLHSRRAKFKRAMKGFAQYVRRPLGLFITVYASLITLFGAAWVLFLIGWISLGSKQSYVINIVDNVLVALFAIIGDGLAPFRAVDTYHMAYIVHYHRKTLKKRKKLGLPKLVDHNDLPDQRIEDVEPVQVDLESLVARRMPRSIARRVAPRIPKRLAKRIVTRSTTESPEYEYSVLTPEQQAKLEYHERKFSKSHTFYKPHETETHYAFPFRLLVAVVVLLDCHSALQITLGACTWGISYHTRPFALTTVVLCCSITCNIMGGVLISLGDKRTRKRDVIERMMRQELTAEGIQQMETRWLKEAEERGEVDASLRKKVEEQRDEVENEEIKRAWKHVPALPKILLGKGEDHRQPSLPQRARRSNANVASTASSSSAALKGRSNTIPPVHENLPLPSRPQPALTRGNEPPKEGLGQKIIRNIRRADLDRS